MTPLDSYVQRIQTAFQTLKRSIESEIAQDEDCLITGPQLFMLYYISRHERCKLTQIAEKLEVKPSAVTVMIDRLEKQGFVKRTHDETDRRSIRMTITPEGAEALDRAMQKRAAVLGRYLTRLEPDERRLLAELLEKMTEPAP